MAGGTMLRSIRNHTDCTGVDFKIITADLEVLKQLGPDMCHFVGPEIKARYKNVAYYGALPKERYCHSWYRFELFSFSYYDRVICIDSDCLCVGDISYLFSEELNEFDLASVEDHIVSKTWCSDFSALQAQGMDTTYFAQRMREGKIDIQPALIVANKSVVNEGWYNKLIKYANATPFTYSIDQGILNNFIYQENLKIKLLPIEWDYQDLYEIHIPSMPVPSNPIIVHCQQSKPFKNDRNSIDPRLQKWYDLWWKEYYALGSTSY
jgi:lipopolysaccharide biosynthesis glycosyltransferase